MRIATWNVNSLKARLEKVEWWLERAAPDVLLMQETKLADDDAPGPPVPDAGLRAPPPRRGALERRGDREPGRDRGRRDELRRRAGAATAAPGRAASAPGDEDFDPLDEARMVSAVCGGVRVVSIYAPNGRVVDSPWYAGKLRWFERLERWLGETQSTRPARSCIGGDFNVAPTDEDVWDAAAAHGGTHVSEPERAAFRALLDLGPRRHVAGGEPGPAPLHLVGLPGRQLPAQRGDADRPPPRERAGRRAGRGGGGRPRGPQGHPDPVRPRAARPRPRRAREAVRRGLGAARTSGSLPAAPPRRAERGRASRAADRRGLRSGAARARSGLATSPGPGAGRSPGSRG